MQQFLTIKCAKINTTGANFTLTKRLFPFIKHEIQHNPIFTKQVHRLPASLKRRLNFQPRFKIILVRREPRLHKMETSTP